MVTAARLDYVSLKMDSEWVVDLNLVEPTGIKPWLGYGPLWRGPFGVVAASSETQAWWLVKLGGEALSVFHDALAVWCNIGSATRLDFCVDTDEVSMADVVAACESGSFVGCHQYSYHRSPTGETVYLGSRTSDIFVRIYNMRGPVRVEFEVKGKVCAELASMLASGSATVESAFAWLLGRIRFVEGSGSHKYRSPVLAWWASLSDALAPAVNIPVRKVQDAIRWFQRSCMRTCARFVTEVGVQEFFWALRDAQRETKTKSVMFLDDVERRLVGLPARQLDLPFV